MQDIQQVLIHEARLKGDGSVEIECRALDDLASQLRRYTLRSISARDVYRTDEPMPWRVIVPGGVYESLGKAIASRLNPLLCLRSQNHPNAADPIVFDPNPNLEISDAVIAWEANVLKDHTYVLLLAGPVQAFPHELYKVLALNHHVGRLALESLDDYGAYAQKVVRYCQPASQRGLVTFAPAHDGPTQIGYNQLICPLESLITRLGPLAQRIEKENATVTALHEALHQSGAPPRLLVVAAHGLAMEPTQIKELRPLSPRSGGGESREADALLSSGIESCLGAPVDRHKQCYRPQFLSQADSNQPVLEGGVVLLFSCNGAGQWGVSPLRPSPPSAPAPPDVISGLPARLLALPRGPLCVIAHVDPVWLVSLADARGNALLSNSVGGSDALVRAVERLMTGHSMYNAVTALRQRGQNTGYVYSRVLAGQGPKGTGNNDGNDARLIRSWAVASNDGDWVILGDPLVGLGHAGVGSSQSQRFDQGEVLRDGALRQVEQGRVRRDGTTRGK